MVENEAQRHLDNRLKDLSLPKKVSYTAKEVQNILSVSRSTLDRMFHCYVEDSVTGRVEVPRSIKSSKINNERRVSFYDLLAFIARYLAVDQLLDSTPQDAQFLNFGDMYLANAPCPHCSCPKASPVQSPGGEQVAFRCQGCGSTGPVQDTWHNALAGWNMRC